MRRGRKIGGALRRVLASGALLLATASPAAADTLVVQPDGKIVLTDGTSSRFGALARLRADGSLDPSFGQGGFVLDHRAPPFGALALQGDGRIVAGAFGGSVLARYLPEGALDPSFSGDGFSEAPVRGQSQGYFERDPFTVLTQPGGTIAVAEALSRSADGASEVLVSRYDAQGGLLETTGRVPSRSGAVDPVAITDLVEQSNGALVGAGWVHGYEARNLYTRPLLARFIPGSGSDFDASFGSGAGLVRPRFGTPEVPATFSALAAAGDQLVAAGGVDRSFLVAKFDRDGNLDPTFGEGGYAIPAIAGTAPDTVLPGWPGPRSWVNDVAVAAGGDVLAAGGTTRWGTWTVNKLGPQCTGCPQPLLARFDSSGHLDPSFGNGGLLLLAKPDGAVFEEQIEQVTLLPDGKTLIRGGGPYGTPFVARLEEDGSYDRGFGNGGLVTLELPCTTQSEEQLEQAGCVASATMTLRLRGLRRGFPVVSMRLKAHPSWAGIRSVSLELPRGLQPTRRLRAGGRFTVSGGSGGRGVVRVFEQARFPRYTVSFGRLGGADELKLKLRRGSLITTAKKRGQRPRLRSVRLKVGVSFAHATWGTGANDQDFVRRVG